MRLKENFMIYRDFKGKKLSLLGFGAMRLPTVGEGVGEHIDMPLAEKMFDVAIKSGVNYFDTAFPYHKGESETAVGKILSKYPRDSYYLATKYPGHQIMTEYNPKEIFERQLEKCGVDYFDFYLLHNVNETSIDTYLDKHWGILDYFIEQKRLGRIRHLGFSTHASVEGIREFLEVAGEHMEFCQIQLNYLDYTLQRAKEKCELLDEYGIPIWVMEPVRGGRLANLPEHAAERLKALRPEESVASWCFRWLHRIPTVGMILSGMSNMEQVEDNIRTFSGGEPLSDAEADLLLEIADGMKKTVPCTVCRYCVDGCPMKLDIPYLIGIYNELSYAKGMNAAMRVQLLPEEEKPDKCIKCGRCSKICPQRIDIPKVLSDLDKIVSEMPSWRDECLKRDEECRAGSKNS